MIVFERSGMKRVAGLDRSSSEEARFRLPDLLFGKRLGGLVPSRPWCTCARLHRGSTVPRARAGDARRGHPLGRSFPLTHSSTKSYSVI